MKTMRFLPFFLVWLVLPMMADTVDFSRDIHPILAAHCTKCHGGEKPKGGLDMTSREGMHKELKSGERSVAPGKPGQSELLRRLT